jgi:hypothetical protein
VGEECKTTKMAASMSRGSSDTKVFIASNAPADPPMTMMSLLVVIGMDLTVTMTGALRSLNQMPRPDCDGPGQPHPCTAWGGANNAAHGVHHSGKRQDH